MTGLNTLLQERMEMLLRVSDLLVMKILREVLDMWADPENIEDFISYSWTDLSSVHVIIFQSQLGNSLYRRG